CATTRIRRSSSADCRVGRVGTGRSARRARAHQPITSALKPMKTASPTQRPPSAAAITIAAKYATVASRNRNASDSLRKGLITLEDVDGRVHDDPHDVHEVPVDPRDLDAVVGARGVVASESTERRRP